MKKIIISTILLFTAGGLFAQKPVTIEGTFSIDKTAEVKLFKVNNGIPGIIATSKPTANKSFGFLFTPDYEGLYLIGTGNATSPMGNYKFWFKPGDKLSFTITDSSYELTGSKNSKENQALYKWYQTAWQAEWKSVYFSKNISTYVDFFPVLNKLYPEAKNWATMQKPTKNKKFDAALQDIVNFDIAFFAVNFLTTPRSAHPDAEEMPAYYSDFTVNKVFPQAKYVYVEPYGRRAFSSVLMNELLRSPAEGNDKFSIENALKIIDSDTLKGDYVLDRASGNRDYGQYIEFIKKYEQYIITDDQRNREFNLDASLATLKPGDKGYEFKYEDKNGKMVSFSDLKGKVVLIDTWATWCGPCKVEIPHLKKLEKEMEGKDVAIVSISVDETKDKDKWKQMIQDENLGGIQLFANGWSDITQYYKIKGIPRFMVFDKEGRIVTVDAPRPSSPDLKILLENHL